MLRRGLKALRWKLWRLTLCIRKELKQFFAASVITCGIVPSIWVAFAVALPLLFVVMWILATVMQLAQAVRRRLVALCWTLTTADGTTGGRENLAGGPGRVSDFDLSLTPEVSEPRLTQLSALSGESGL